MSEAVDSQEASEVRAILQVLSAVAKKCVHNFCATIRLLFLAVCYCLNGFDLLREARTDRLPREISRPLECARTAALGQMDSHVFAISVLLSPKNPAKCEEEAAPRCCCAHSAAEEDPQEVRSVRALCDFSSWDVGECEQYGQVQKGTEWSP